MPRYFILILLFVFSVSVHAQNHEKKMAKAVKLFENGKYQSAKEYLDKCIADDPAYAEYYWLRGICFQYLLNAPLALKDLDKAVLLHPDSSKYIVERALFYSHTLQYYKAAEDYKTAIPLQKNRTDSATVMAALAFNMRNMGDTLGSLTMFEHALALDSNNILILNDYALLLTNLEAYDKAIYYLTRITDIDSLNKSAIMNIGYVYGVKGEHAKSLPYLDRAIRMQPDDAFAYSNRGYAKLKLGDLNGASSDLNKSIELNPYNPYVYRNLGLLLLEQDEPDKACKAFETALFYKFSERYGNEVKELRKKHCTK